KEGARKWNLTKIFSMQSYAVPESCPGAAQAATALKFKGISFTLEELCGGETTPTGS
ncbi:hypothetical protein BGZ81_000188, partial [Podila clonocystis]